MLRASLILAFVGVVIVMALVVDLAASVIGVSTDVKSIRIALCPQHFDLQVLSRFELCAG